MRNFVAPEMEIMKFEAMDVITASIENDENMTDKG